ncbi:MAG: TIGR03619 family F420-dependent LLM class oxidoreductase [Pseudomonadales bacterium]
MKIGIIPINIGVQSAEQMIALARHAESVGVESLWTFEHVIVPVDYASKYPYSPNGKMGAAPETPFVDPLIALTAIAAATRTVRLATGVNILSQANPIYLAKQTASLDFVSNGRFMLGVGIGWLEEEFKVVGTPFERRGARFDDYVEAMRKVWSGEVVEHQSEFLDWSGFKSYPLPVQNPMPVIIGGSKGRVHERIARYGNGWYAPSGDPGEIADHLTRIAAKCAKLGRKASDIEVTAMWQPSAGVDALKRLAEVGVARVTVPLFGMKDPVADLSRLGDEVIAKLA